MLSSFHLLVDKLMPLTTADLEALEDDPEEWLMTETVDEEAWAFEFRVSAELLHSRLSLAVRRTSPHSPEQRMSECSFGAQSD